MAKREGNELEPSHEFLTRALQMLSSISSEPVTEGPARYFLAVRPQLSSGLIICTRDPCLVSLSVIFKLAFRKLRGRPDRPSNSTLVQILRPLVIYSKHWELRKSSTESTVFFETRDSSTKICYSTLVLILKFRMCGSLERIPLPTRKDCHLLPFWKPVSTTKKRWLSS